MTLQEVKDTLPNVEGNVFMELFNCYISPEDFITRFQGASLTYKSLYEHANATTGWKMQFDEWKEKGVIV